MPNGHSGKAAKRRRRQRRIEKTSVEFIDNSGAVLKEFLQAKLLALEKCGFVAEDYAKHLAPVDTGGLRNSISHRVELEEGAVFIGSNKEYAVYVELGTGQYTPGGRPTTWSYQDEKGQWHRTRGQKPQPFLKPAVEEHRDQYRQIVKDEMENG